MTTQMRAMILKQTDKRFVLHTAHGLVMATAANEFEGAALQRLLGLMLSDMNHAGL